MAATGKFYGWTLLAVSWAILTINMGFAIYGSSVINTAMALALHFDRGTLGAGAAVSQWCGGLPAPLVAICVNRMGSRFTLVLGSVILGVGALALAVFARTPLPFIITYGAVIGLAGLVGGSLPMQALMARWFVRHRGRAIALMLTAPAIGGMIWPGLINIVITRNHGAWQAGWWLGLAAAIATSLASFLLVKESPAVLGQQPDGVAAPLAEAAAALLPASPQNAVVAIQDGAWQQILRVPAFWLLQAALAALYGGFLMFATHGVIHLEDVGFTPGQAVTSFSITFAFVLAGNLLFAAIGDRVQARYMVSIAANLFALGLLIAIKPAGRGELYGYPVFLGIGFGIGFSAMMVLPSDYFGDKGYITVIGMMLAIATSYGALASFGAGKIFDWLDSYTPAFALIILLSLAGAILILFLPKPPPRTPG